MASTWNAVDVAERGAALLDRKVPGWLDRIDAATLNISHCQRCVLGQLFGEYEHGIWKTGVPSHAVAAAHGFSVALDAFPSLSAFDAAWGELTAAWRELIARRRLALISQREAVAA